MVLHLLNIINFFLPPTRFFWLRRLAFRTAGVNLGTDVKLCGRGWFYGHGKVDVGANTWISQGLVCYSHLDSPIFIGSSCDIGPGVKILTGTHQIGPSFRRAGLGFSKSVTIESGCWIGAEVVLLPGCRVGNGSVVAAGSVVNGIIPPNSLAAGVPAKVKKVLGPL